MKQLQDIAREAAEAVWKQISTTNLGKPYWANVDTESIATTLYPYLRQARQKAGKE